MKKKLFILIFTVILLTVSAFAADTFDAGITVNRDTDGQIIVTIPDSDILAEKKPTLTIPCDFDAAYVTANGEQIDSILDTDAGTITFTVREGGTYIIHRGTPTPQYPTFPDFPVIPNVPTVPTVPNPPADDPVIDEPTEEPKPEPSVKPMEFSDVTPADWFYEPVRYVYENRLFFGVTDTKFQPNTITNRAMLITVLWRMEGMPVVNYLMQYTDVPSDEYYAEAVRWATSEGIASGVSAAEFAPSAPITREQAVTFLYRYAIRKGYDVSGFSDLRNFTDAAAVSDYAESAMRWACGAGIIRGDEGRLNPTGSATRAQLAAMLYAFAQWCK